MVSREGRDATDGLIEQTTFESDARGNIVTVETKTNGYPDQNGNSTFNRTTKIEYNADQLPEIETSIVGEGIPNRTRYTYSNGNIVRSLLQTPVIVVSIGYVYDDKPNPLYGLVGFTAELFDIVNRNNVVNPSFYTYEYDSNNLLIKRVYNTGSIVQTTTYAYELY